MQKNCFLQARQCAFAPPLVRRSCTHHKRKDAVKTRSFSTADKAASTISSLDNILGSRDEMELQEQPQAAPIQLLRVPGWAWSEIREPRVAPATSNVLYYLLLIVYTSYYVVQLADGQEVADDLLARLANDHAAVSSGDTLRMFTCFFVADSTPQLIIALLGLATVAAELESLLGVSTFWAVWCVTVLAGSLADAAFSTVPITAGPAAGVGGAAAALLAHHLHNWRIEQLLAQAKSGHVPEPLMQLEHTYNRQRRLEAASESVDSSNTIDAAGSNSGGGDAQLAEQQQQQRGEALMSDDSLVNAELEGPAGLSVSLMLPREGKAFVTLGGTAVAVLSALKDAADTDVATDWAALVAGFVVGGVLGWLVCPVYAIELRPASSSGADVLGEGAGQQPDLLLPVLHDMRPLAERANALVGAAALLFAALGAWLTTQGMFS